MAILNSASLTSKISTGGELIDANATSNSVVSYNISTEVTAVKETRRSWAIRGEKISIKTTVSNNTNFNIEDVSIHDTLNAGATFVEGSLTIGSVAYENLNPITGFTFPATIGAFSEMDFAYEIIVGENDAYDEAINQSEIGFNVDSQDFVVQSNALNITILTNQITMLKECNVVACKQGDELTYTITITNDGTLLNTDIMVFDQIPAGTTFVENSVKINNTLWPGADPSIGISYSNLNAGDQLIIEFKVTVDWNLTFKQNIKHVKV